MRKLSMITALILVVTFTFAISAMGAAPTKPIVTSMTHQEGGTSTVNEISVKWTASTDSDGDLEGYATKWDNSSSTIPMQKTLGASATSTTSSPLADGTWYFHITALDSEFNGLDSDSPPVDHFGPITIKTQPSIASISPSNGSSGTSITIYGTAFMEGATAKIGTTSMTSVVVVSDTELTGTVPSGLSTATYDVTVTNPNNKYATKTNGFTVSSSDNSAPQISAGTDQSVEVGSSLTFSEATATDSDDDTMTYTWSVLTPPSGATADTDYTLTSTSSLNGVTFTPVTDNAVGSFVLKLTVSDGKTSVSDTVTVTVTSGGTTTGKPGDVNNSGSVDIFDVLDVIDLMGTTDPTADVNDSGSVDIFDVLEVIDLMGT